MRNRHDNSLLSELREKIVNDPSGDYDDALFQTLLRAVALNKEVMIERGAVENHGKRYRRARINGDGRKTPLRALLLSFLGENVEYDGFLLDDIIIEKGFIEEIISAIDDSTIYFSVDDYKTMESDAVMLFEGKEKHVEAKDSNLNTDIILVARSTSKVAELATSFKEAFSIMIEKGLHTLSLPLPKTIDKALFTAVALSSLEAYMKLYGEHYIQIALLVENEEDLNIIFNK